jgi:glycosyltransferase involved in cell wall biosynthesis
MSGAPDAVVLSWAPLSRRYLEQVALGLGAVPQLIELKQLRGLGALGALRVLRGVRAARLVVPVEDESARHLLPLLQMVAAATGAQRLYVAGEDLRLVPISRWSVLPFVLQFVWSTLANASDTARASLRLAGLRRRRRIPFRPLASRSVLYINGNLWFGVKAGGSIGHVAGVINALLRRGYRVRSAASSPAALLDPQAVHVPLRPQHVLGVPVELNSYGFHHRTVNQLRRQLRRAPAGFIYQRLSLGNFVGIELSRRSGVPLVTEYNGSEVWAQQHWGRPLAWPKLATRAEEAMLRHSHLIVTVSDVLRDELISRGVEPQRIVAYPNCIDPGVFDPGRFSGADRAAVRARYAITPTALVATFIGTFGRWHGVDVLAQAIRRLLDEQRDFLEQSRLHFLLVGDGLKMAEVRATLAHPCAERYVTLAGLVPQREAPLYLAASDILLSPHVHNPDGSRFFGSPTKLFEYMAMGKAIIASDLDQIGEVLANSLRVGQLPDGAPDTQETRVALLCRPGSVEDLITALHFLVTQPDSREYLGRNVRAQALARYTWDHHVGEILEGVARVARLEGAAVSAEGA